MSFLCNNVTNSTPKSGEEYFLLIVQVICDFLCWNTEKSAIYCDVRKSMMATYWNFLSFAFRCVTQLLVGGTCNNVDTENLFIP